MSADILKMEPGTVFEAGKLLPMVSDEEIVFTVVKQLKKVAILQGHWMGVSIGVFNYDGKAMFRESA
jgi:hypothetical protein